MSASKSERKLPQPYVAPPCANSTLTCDMFFVLNLLTLSLMTTSRYFTLDDYGTFQHKRAGKFPTTHTSKLLNTVSPNLLQCMFTRFSSPLLHSDWLGSIFEGVLPPLFYKLLSIQTVVYTNVVLYTVT